MEEWDNPMYRFRDTQPTYDFDLWLPSSAMIYDNWIFEEEIEGYQTLYVEGRESETFTTHEYYGHCAVIYGLENGMIQAYEQKGELGELVAEYDREYLGSETIASVIIPPDFSGTPTDFIHGQAPMNEEETEE